MYVCLLLPSCTFQAIPLHNSKGHHSPRLAFPRKTFQQEDATFYQAPNLQSSWTKLERCAKWTSWISMFLTSWTLVYGRNRPHDWHAAVPSRISCTCHVTWHYMKIYLAYVTYYYKEMYGQVKYYTRFKWTDNRSTGYVIDIHMEQCTNKRKVQHIIGLIDVFQGQIGIERDTQKDNHPLSILTFLWVHFLQANLSV